MTRDELAAKLYALAELAEAEELDVLPVEKPYLADALIECIDGALAWHRTNERAPLVWCGGCNGLRGRKHGCKP